MLPCSTKQTVLHLAMLSLNSCALTRLRVPSEASKRLRQQAGRAMPWGAYRELGALDGLRAALVHDGAVPQHAEREVRLQSAVANAAPSHNATTGLPAIAQSQREDTPWDLRHRFCHVRCAGHQVSTPACQAYIRNADVQIVSDSKR